MKRIMFPHRFGPDCHISGLGTSRRLLIPCTTDRLFERLPSQPVAPPPKLPSDASCTILGYPHEKFALCKQLLNHALGRRGWVICHQQIYAARIGELDGQRAAEQKLHMHL
jgi:hypothetical protein